MLFFQTVKPSNSSISLVKIDFKMYICIPSRQKFNHKIIVL